MRRTAVFLLAAALAVGCSPKAQMDSIVKTQPSPAPREAGPPVGTYSLVPFSETMAVGIFNDEVLAGLEEALVEALESRGYEKDDDDPDYLVALYAVREGKFQSSEWGYLYGWKKKEWDAYWYERKTAARKQGEGAVVLDLLDAAGKKLFWSGTAREALFPGSEGDRRNKTAEEAIEEILQSAPPPHD